MLFFFVIKTLHSLLIFCIQTYFLLSPLLVSINSSSPPDCSEYRISSNMLDVDPPQLNSKSSIANIFNLLNPSTGKWKAKLVKQPSGLPPCYEWACQSKDRQGEECRWCLPSVFVAGFAKCGTTALCDKLVTHPDLRFYKKKENNIFTKMSFGISEFEKKINSGSKQTTRSKDTNSSRVRKVKAPPEVFEGNMWLDCSAGAFRDFNAAAHLKKYSPQTKIVMIVRDPWQNIGSRVAQQSRNGKNSKTQIDRIISEFQHQQYSPNLRFSSMVLDQFAKRSDYAYAEKLLFWKAAFPLSSNLYIIDQYDLEHNPQETMFNLETFINISHFNYSQALLLRVSHNANFNQEERLNLSSLVTLRQPSFSLNQSLASILHSNINNVPSFGNISNLISSDIKSAGRNDTNRSNSIGYKVVIHKPYSFESNTELLHLSRNVLNPSLCLFEKLVGWKIKIITESEK